MRTFELNPLLKRVLQRAHSLGIFWVASQTMEHLKALRTYELGVVLKMLPPQGKLLEIGAGAGWQSHALASAGYDVSAIDLSSSTYLKDRVYPISVYDGKTIPFEDNTFDIVFSSNTLEHIPHVQEFQKEIHRVLKPTGIALHVLPSSFWRFWTNVTYILKTWRPIPCVHGEHAANSLLEIYYFSSGWWKRMFLQTKWLIANRETNGLFYTGVSIMDSRLSISARRKLSGICGSSCNIFVLRK